MKQRSRAVRSIAIMAVGLGLTMVVPVRANVTLSNIFGDHMVLQRGTAVPIWGWADPNESITVTAGNAKATATAGADGKWTATLHDLKASDKPMDVAIAGKNTVTLHDVLVGDVWICSGQSNMQFCLAGGKYGFGGGASNAAEEVPKANHPLLRLFRVQKNVALKPEKNMQGEWKVCTPESASSFSAIGYFFGRDVLKGQHVPVGMIGTYIAGTPAQAWTSMPAIKSSPVLGDYVEQYAERIKKVTPSHPKVRDSTPSTLFNGMVYPLIPYAIKGIIWYQGASNAGHPQQYETLFPTMINDWRSRWGRGDFPFIWVQLANYDNKHPHSPNPSQRARGWPGLRDAQTKTLKLPNTAQAVIIDIGEGNNIHFHDKVDVSARLYAAARHLAYGQSNVYSGPMFDSMKISGNTATIHFKHVGTGLTIASAPSGKPGVPPKPVSSDLKGFSIAGPNHHFFWADAKISGNNVILASPKVPDPKAVRYGWADNPPVNLYNKEGLPAMPFRTDDWPDPKK